MQALGGAGLQRLHGGGSAAEAPAAAQQQLAVRSGAHTCLHRLSHLQR